MQIKKLKLFSKDPLIQADFYQKKLGFKLLNASVSSCSLEMLDGTVLTFEKTGKFVPYHFAFNIPSFQIKEALAWLQTIGVELIPYEGEYLVDFKSWNADAVYFYDPDGNILELIARKNQNIKTDQAFSEKSILSISEIGMPVEDVYEISEWLKTEVALKQYSGDQSYFCALGDEEGLFIIVDEARKKWMPTEILAKPAAFETLVVAENGKWEINYTTSELKIISYDPLQK